jgi:hypothetical protein
MATYQFFSDPAHGWLKVKVSVLATLGIINNISPYSYIRGDYAYLEEDLDAGVFINAFKEKNNGEAPSIKARKQANRSSIIRTYQSYYSILAKDVLLKKSKQLSK